jgi:hypothetical protein
LVKIDIKRLPNREFWRQVQQLVASKPGTSYLSPEAGWTTVKWFLVNLDDPSLCLYLPVVL